MATAAQAVKGPASRLGQVQRGKLKLPDRCVFYGPEGVGKSTLAAHAPSPIWIDVENGSSHLDVARYMFRDDPDNGHVPQTFDEVIAAIGDLGRSQHDYKTLVIDAVDQLEGLMWDHMVKRDKSKSKHELENVEDYGYGKGYNIAVDEWRALCCQLDVLRATRKMTVILLAHAQVSTFKNPEGDDYERYSIQLNNKAAGFVKKWADVVGFCHFDEGGKKLKGAAKAKGWSTGRRLINFVRTAAYDAKGRGGMAAEVEMELGNPWAPFQKAMDDASNLTAPALASLISVETARIGDADVTVKVDAAVAQAVAKNDTETLNRYLQDLKRREAKGAVTQ